MLAWTAAAAAADPAPPAPAPDPAPPPAPIEIAPADAVPSAVDGVDQAAAETAPLPGALDLLPQVEDWVAMPGNLVRGRAFVRPVLGVAFHADRGAVRLGGAIGHQWWTLDDRTLRVGGETALRATAPVGGGSGYRVDLGTQAGPWLGPVGVWAGPLVRAQRETWGDDTLPAAVLAGGSLELTADFGRVGLLAGVQPLASLTGDPPGDGAAGGALPAIGAETTWKAGVRGNLGPIELGLELADRETAIGSVVEGGVTLHLRLK